MNITMKGEMPMPPVWETLIDRYGWIFIGLTFGFAAKYALLIKKGVKVRPWLVIADLLLLPMVLLVAYVIAGRFGLMGEIQALVAGICMVLSDRLLTLLTERFFQRVDSEATALANQMMGRARQTVANEQVAGRLIEDTIEGRAPTEYQALKPHPQVPRKPGAAE